MGTQDWRIGLERATCLAALALACALATGLEASPAQQAPAPASQPARPLQAAPSDRNGILILVRSTLLALHHANETGNYTVLRDLAAPGFQASNNAARLAEIFVNQRNQRLDLSAVAVLEPQLTVPPRIEANGLLRLAGVFPSAPLQVQFDLLFAPVDGRWRLFGVSLDLERGNPAGPAPGAKP